MHSDTIPRHHRTLSLCGILTTETNVRSTALFLVRQEVEEIPCGLHIQDAPSSYYGGT